MMTSETLWLPVPNQTFVDLDSVSDIPTRYKKPPPQPTRSGLKGFFSPLTSRKSDESFACRSANDPNMAPIEHLASGRSTSPKDSTTSRSSSETARSSGSDSSHTAVSSNSGTTRSKSPGRLSKPRRPSFSKSAIEPQKNLNSLGSKVSKDRFKLGDAGFESCDTLKGSQTPSSRPRTHAKHRSGQLSIDRPASIHSVRSMSSIRSNIQLFASADPPVHYPKSPYETPPASPDRLKSSRSYAASMGRSSVDEYSGEKRGSSSSERMQSPPLRHKKAISRPPTAGGFGAAARRPPLRHVASSLIAVPGQSSDVVASQRNEVDEQLSFSTDSTSVPQYLPVPTVLPRANTSPSVTQGNVEAERPNIALQAERAISRKNPGGHLPGSRPSSATPQSASARTATPDTIDSSLPVHTRHLGQKRSYHYQRAVALAPVSDAQRIRDAALCLQTVLDAWDAGLLTHIDHVLEQVAAARDTLIAKDRVEIQTQSELEKAAAAGSRFTKLNVAPDPKSTSPASSKPLQAENSTSTIKNRGSSPPTIVPSRKLGKRPSFGEGSKKEEPPAKSKSMSRRLSFMDHLLPSPSNLPYGFMSATNLTSPSLLELDQSVRSDRIPDFDNFRLTMEPVHERDGGLYPRGGGLAGNGSAISLTSLTNLR